MLSVSGQPCSLCFCDSLSQGLLENSETKQEKAPTLGMYALKGPGWMICIRSLDTGGRKPGHNEYK